MTQSAPQCNDIGGIIQSDPQKTAGRIDELNEYVHRNLLTDGKFVCEHYQACRASGPKVFYEGQMSHVGKHYDLTVGGRELRIVVVGQEYGQRSCLVDLEARTAMIDGSAGKDFTKRNPHMAGTTSILRLLLGRQAGKDSQGEKLFQHGARTGHVFDGFALVNYLLCSALTDTPKGMNAGKGCSTQKMKQNCAKHFLRTLEILEPTVIVAEGQGVRRWIGGPLGLGEKHPTQYDGPATPETTCLAGKPVDILTFNHPSASGRSGWWGKSPKSKYLRLVVEPTIERWRSRVWAGAES